MRRIVMSDSKHELLDLLRQPIPLTPNRVYRFYKGGAMIDRFRGAGHAEDTDYPEDWVGSITPANNPGEGHPHDEGLSRVTLPSGGQITLKALLERFPEQMLGPAHVAKYGSSS